LLEEKGRLMVAAERVQAFANGTRVTQT